jgi:hypothetical protein
VPRGFRLSPSLTQVCERPGREVKAGQDYERALSRGV